MDTTRPSVGEGRGGERQGWLARPPAGRSVRSRILRGLAPLPVAILVVKWPLHAFVFAAATDLSVGQREAIEALVVALVAVAAAILVARSVGGPVDRIAAERERTLGELRRSEEALLASESRLREAQRIAQIGSWELDLVRDTLIWSEEIYRLFEIDPREFGESYGAFLDTVHPDDREFVDRAYTESLRTRAPYDIVHRLRMKDGRVKWVHERCETFYDAAGRPLRSLGTVQNISERQRLDERLRAASRYARSLIEASLDPLVTISPDGKITDVNDATAKATGVARERLVGTDFSSYFTEPERARAGYEQVFERGFVVDYPLALRHVSGRVMEVLYNASVYRDEAGDVIGVFAAARDVTERNRAMQALRQSEERFRAASLYARSLIEASLDPLVTISPDGKITDVNDATVKATGVARERLVGTDFSSYFTEPERARAGYEQVFQRGFVVDYPLALRHVSGRVMEVLYNASVYRDEAGDVIGVFAAARDVTERPPPGAGWPLARQR